MRTTKYICAIHLVILGTVWLTNQTKPSLKLPVEAPPIVEVVEEKPEVITIPEVGVVVTVESPYYSEGEYVTEERISQMTDTGAIGIGAGVKVRKVGEKAGRLLITDGKVVVESPLGKLTNEKSVGAALIEKYSQRVVELPVEDIPSVEPPKEIQRQNTPTLARDPKVESQIIELRRRIRELERKTTSGVNANGPLITRLRIELEKLTK